MTNAAEQPARWISAGIGSVPRNASELACVAGVLLAPDGSIAESGVFATPRSGDLDTTTRSEGQPHRRPGAER